MISEELVQQDVIAQLVPVGPDAQGVEQGFGAEAGGGEAVMAVIALGYRKGEPVQPRHKPLDDVVKFF